MKRVIAKVRINNDIIEYATGIKTETGRIPKTIEKIDNVLKIEFEDNSIVEYCNHPFTIFFESEDKRDGLTVTGIILKNKSSNSKGESIPCINLDEAVKEFVHMETNKISIMLFLLNGDVIEMDNINVSIRG